MKILFVSSYDGNRFVKTTPELDGDSFFTYGFNGRRARNLKKYFPEYDIEVVRFSRYAKGYFEKNIEEIKFKVYPAFRVKYLIDFSFRGLRALLKLSKSEPVLIYISHLHRGLVYLLAFLFKNFPIIVQDHGETPPRIKILSGNILKKSLYGFNLSIEKLVYRYIDFVCLGDQNQAEYIKEVCPNFKGEITPSQGLNIEIFKPIEKITAKKLLGWDLSKKYILYVGRLDKVKHTDELVYMWIELKKEMPEVELIFIGGMETDPFYQLVKEKNVIMYPRTMNVDLPKYYSAADVYVLLGLDNIKFGGMGIAPAESLACGTPVVSSNLRNILGGSLEGIGEAPHTLEGHKDAIKKVLKNPEKYTKCRDVILKHYTENAIATRLDQVIKQVVSKYPHLN